MSTQPVLHLNDYCRKRYFRYFPNKGYAEEIKNAREVLVSWQDAQLDFHSNLKHNFKRIK